MILKTNSFANTMLSNRSKSWSNSRAMAFSWSPSMSWSMIKFCARSKLLNVSFWSENW